MEQQGNVAKNNKPENNIRMKITLGSKAMLPLLIFQWFCKHLITILPDDANRLDIGTCHALSTVTSAGIFYCHVYNFIKCSEALINVFLEGTQERGLCRISQSVGGRKASTFLGFPHRGQFTVESVS